MTDSPAAAAAEETLPEEEDMIVSHDPSTHQARAIAALQQAANTANEHRRDLLGPGTDGPVSQPRVQSHATEQQFSVQTMAPTPIQNSFPTQAVVGGSGWCLLCQCSPRQIHTRYVFARPRRGSQGPEMVGLRSHVSSYYRYG
jgi:hypothetical protein